MTLHLQPDQNASFSPAMSDNLHALQREVQRKLGRCMIRLQQYERSMKAMVANMAVEGPPEKLQSIREQQVACASTKTLGTLIGIFTGSYLNIDASEERVALASDEAEVQSSNQIWVRVNCNIALAPERYEQTKLALAELVAMRNDLVHCLLERYDLTQESDCRDAEVHLDACFEQIDGHYLELMGWVKSTNESRELMASIIRSPQFKDAILHGIGPDEEVHWPISTIVECLRNAEQVGAVDGWTLLDSAIAFIGVNHSDQAPNKYGCKNWRQVLKKSEQFEIRTDINPLNSKGQTWYRSREEATVNHQQAS